MTNFDLIGGHSPRLAFDLDGHLEPPDELTGSQLARVECGKTLEDAGLDDLSRFDVTLDHHANGILRSKLSGVVLVGVEGS